MSTATKSKAAAKNDSLRKAGGAYARKKCEGLFSNSNCENLIHQFPQFTMDELQLGKFLGKGGFGTVKEVRAFSKSSNSSSTKGGKGSPDAVADDGVENRNFIADHCIRNGGDARYAVKYLSPEVVADPGMFIQGITDMGVETRFLSSIQHPNIIKMRAIAGGDAFGTKYFIVMDRLYDTMDKRILKWEKSLKKYTGKLTSKLTDRDGSKAAALLEERLVAAYDLCAAICYLHSRKIIYRDIKPDNIGFDIRQDVKLFDFGLAKELTRDVKAVGDGTYKLTGGTGSIRYMAPEVSNGVPYNEKCDVYSMAILIWQIMACKDPYVNYTPKALRAKVHNGTNRPLIQDSWSQSLKLLLRRGWTGDIEARHTMQSMENILKTEITAIRKGDDTGLEHYRRRSTFVFRGKNKASQ